MLAACHQRGVFHFDALVHPVTHTLDVCIEVLSEAGLLSQQEAEQMTIAYQDYRAAAHLSALKQQKEATSVSTFAVYQQQVSQLWARIFAPSVD